MKPGETYLPNLLRGSVAGTWAPIARHFLPRSGHVLDLTHRTGRQWSDIPEPPFRLTRCDLDPLMPVDLAADCRSVPFRSGLFDAVVVDLPWTEDAGKNSYSGPKYGPRHKRHGELLALLAPAEWGRVARPGAFLFVRCQDAHHEGRFLDLSWDIGQAVRASGVWEPWDRVVCETGGRPPRYAMVQPAKTRKICTFWLVFRRRP